MSVIVFDTLLYSKRAKAHGFTEEQAEFQAEEMAKFAINIEGELATKQDLGALKKDIETLKQSIHRDMEAQEERLLYKLTTRLGGILVAGITILSILMTVLHNMN